MTESRLSSRVLYLVVCAAPPAQHIGELVSLLIDEGWSVCVIPTPQASNWIDTTALVEQTGYPVRHGYRQPGDSKSLPPADAIVVAPATFNTINKWAAGISDNYALGVLNEAIGLKLRIVVTPYVKPSLAAHPAFAASIEKLATYGVSATENESIRRTTNTKSDLNWWPVINRIPHLP